VAFDLLRDALSAIFGLSELKVVDVYQFMTDPQDSSCLMIVRDRQHYLLTYGSDFQILLPGSCHVNAMGKTFEEDDDRHVCPWACEIKKIEFEVDLKVEGLPCGKTFNQTFPRTGTIVRSDVSGRVGQECGLKLTAAGTGERKKFVGTLPLFLTTCASLFTNGPSTVKMLQLQEGRSSGPETVWSAAAIANQNPHLLMNDRTIAVLRVVTLRLLYRLRKEWYDLVNGGKLAPRYVGPFEIIERVGPVAYRLKLPQELSCVHDTFHVSNLKKCLAEPDVQVPLDEIEIDENLRFVEEPIEIVERDVKKLKRRRIPLVKVRWNSRQGAEYTWEREDQFRKKYPNLFSESVLSSSAAT
ncbi:hypothetical protein Tco_1370640, partial [Tanacetum coccineum]